MRQTILILQFGDLGDTILTVPAIRAVRERYPEARVVLAGKKIAADYLLPLQLVDAAIDVDKHLFDRPASIFRPRAVVSLLRLLYEIRRERAGTLILFHHLVSWWGTVKFAGLSLTSGAQRRIGLDNGRGWFLTETVRDRGFGALHEAEYWLEVARLLDAHGHLSLVAPITDADRIEARRLLANGTGGRNVLVIHPGTGAYGPGRRWEPERFAATARAILREHDLVCVLVGTAVDAEAAERVASRLDAPVVNLVGRTSIGVLGAVLERSALVLANDGGVAHLAAAAGARVVTVFGPSNDRAWRPIGAEVVAVDLPCRPCFYRGLRTGLPEGCATRDCLALVTPAMVAHACLSTLGEAAGVH